MEGSTCIDYVVSLGLTEVRRSIHRLPVKVGFAARRDGGGRGSHVVRDGDTVVNVVEP